MVLCLVAVDILIRGTASDVLGIVSDTVLRNTVSESNTVTSEIRWTAIQYEGSKGTGAILYRGGGDRVVLV